MSESDTTTFLTGATGFLGHFILRDLLLRGRRMVAMVRSPIGDTGHRLQVMLRRIGLDAGPYLESGQLLLVEGSLPDHLPVPDWGPTNEIISCAASLQLFANGNKEPFNTNVTGTQRLIEWADRHEVTRIHAVSTAYVCGWPNEPVCEVFHRTQPEFQTEYERSKWLAEALFEHWGRQNSNVLTVFRPGFLVGDSQTGYTTQFGGFYQLARMVSIMKEQYAETNGNGNGHGGPAHVPLRIPGRPEDRQSAVPVDFASQVIAEVVSNRMFHGRIYHLTDPRPPRNNDFKQWFEEYFDIHGGYFVDSVDAPGEMSAAESLLWEQYELIVPRFTHRIKFEWTNTEEVMGATGIQYPTMDRERMFTLLDYAQSARWGQRSRRQFV